MGKLRLEFHQTLANGVITFCN